MEHLCREVLLNPIGGLETVLVFIGSGCDSHAAPVTGPLGDALTGRNGGCNEIFYCINADACASFGGV